MSRIVRAILFDLDDTLVDSSAVVVEIMQSWCSKRGIPWEMVRDVCHGGRTEDTVALVAPHLCAKTEAAEIELLESTSFEGLMPIQGARCLLDTLDPQRWAVATSSSRMNAIAKLKACHLPIPQVLITAESVSQGKPHPEAFLKAAAALGVKPEECLVCEDADNGVRSALSAGCWVLIVGDRCRIENRRVVGRVASFDDIHLTGGDGWMVDGELVACLSRE